MTGCRWKLTLSYSNEKMCRLAALVHFMYKIWGSMFFTSLWGVAFVMHCNLDSRRNDSDFQQMNTQVPEVVYAGIQLQGLMKYGLINFNLCIRDCFERWGACSCFKWFRTINWIMLFVSIRRAHGSLLQYSASVRRFRSGKRLRKARVSAIELMEQRKNRGWSQKSVKVIGSYSFQQPRWTFW